MKVYEMLTGYSLVDKDAPPEYTVYEYEQPPLRRALYLVAEQADKLTWSTSLGKRVLGLIDSTAIKLHKRHCNNDCALGWQRLPGDPPHTIPTDDAHRTRMCAYMPPTNQADMWLFDLSRKERTFLAKYAKEE